MVERVSGYFETPFLPGRSFTGPEDFNTQLTDWLVLANARRHRWLGTRPVERWDTDRSAMLTPPPVAPERRQALEHSSGESLMATTTNATSGRNVASELACSTRAAPGTRPTKPFGTPAGG